MRKGIGIDLGGTNLRVCLSGRGTVIREPALAAVERDSERILKFGDAAEAYLKERPQNVTMTRPFRNGVVSQCETAKKVFDWCRKRCSATPDDAFRALISVPCSLSDVEQSAMIEVAVHAGYAEPYLVYAPVAALYGCGFSVDSSVMVVHIGATKTDIIAVHKGACVYRDSTDAAGDLFDEAIVSYVQQNSHVRLGLRTAETVKNRIGTVWLGGNPRCLELGGQDAYRNRKTVRISSEQMFTIFEEPTAALMEAICKAISSLPLNAVKDIFENGVILTGGCAQLDGLDKMISGVTGVRCRRAEEPGDAVIRGLDVLLRRMPATVRQGCINLSEILFHER